MQWSANFIIGTLTENLRFGVGNHTQVGRRKLNWGCFVLFCAHLAFFLYAPWCVSPNGWVWLASLRLELSNFTFRSRSLETKTNLPCYIVDCWRKLNRRFASRKKEHSYYKLCQISRVVRYEKSMLN